LFTRILTDFERKKIKAFLKQDGEKNPPVRKIAMRARRDLPTIKADLDLLEALLRKY
jgi:hypothetical protein